MSPKLSMVPPMNGNPERAFLRAREILCKEGALTPWEYDELGDLFHEVNETQFMALAQDPRHRRALRAYDRHARRPALPIIIAMAMMFALSVAIGLYLSLQG